MLTPRERYAVYGTESPGTETLTDYLYDTGRIKQGTERLYFFIEPVGINGKTFLETNMLASGTLTHGRFGMTGFAISTRGQSEPHPCLHNAVFELFIGSKRYAMIAPAIMLHRWNITIASIAGEDVRRNNRPAWDLGSGWLMIEQRQNFCAHLSWPGAGAVLNDCGEASVSVELYGAMQRPVA